MSCIDSEKILKQSSTCNSLFKFLPNEIITKIANEVTLMILIEEHGKYAPCFAARKGRGDWLLLLQEAGCDLSQVDKSGRTPAHWAALNGHKGCLRLLKEARCNLGQANQNGFTPAHNAAVGGHKGCLRVLKEAGCDLG